MPETKNKTNERLHGSLYVIISATIFGLMPLMTKTILNHGANGYTAAFFRYAIGSLILYAVIKLSRNKTIRIEKKQIGIAALFSLFYASLLAFLFTSYSYIQLGLATTLHFTYPAIVILLNLIIYKAVPSKNEIFSLCLAIAGVFLMNAYGGDINATGVVFAILSGVSLAAFAVLFEHSSLKSQPTIVATFWISVFSAIDLAVFITLTGNWQLPSDSTGWIMTGVMAITTGVIALVCFQKGIATCGSVTASLLSTLEPITSLLIGWVMFNEDLTTLSLIAVACILCSALVLLIGKPKASEKKAMAE